MCDDDELIPITLPRSPVTQAQVDEWIKRQGWPLTTTGIRPSADTVVVQRYRNLEVSHDEGRDEKHGD